MTAAKELLEYLFDRLKAKQPATQRVNDQEYALKADGTIGEPIRELAPKFDAPTLRVSTLSGLVSVYRAKLDDLPEACALHIESPMRVSLLSTMADAWGRRHQWAFAEHRQETLFTFGKYYSSEEFLILFRSAFLFNENAVKIQRLLSGLTTENSVSVADDGLSQVVTIKDGTVTRTAVELPPEIPLIPWRTFRDAAPVESKFMLRLKSVQGGVPAVALFEVDAMWALDTVQSIASYLQAQLPDARIIT